MPIIFRHAGVPSAQALIAKTPTLGPHLDHIDQSVGAQLSRWTAATPDSSSQLRPYTNFLAAAVKAKAKPQAQPAEPKAKPALSKSDQCECEEDSAGLASCKWCKPREWGLTDNFEPARLHVFNTGQVSARLV